MRILHVSDTHVGFTAYARVTSEGLNQREQDFFDGLTRAFDVALAERVDAVLHTGDLFDAVRPTNRAISHAMAEFRRLHDAGIPSVVIAGNHEAPRLRETGSVLRLLDFLPGVTAVYKGRVETVRIGDLAVHAVPHASDNDALLEELRAVRPDPDARHNVAMLHAGVMGVGDFRTGEFNEQVVPQNELPDAMDHVALGHYHRATQVADRAWYAGSTERGSFKEAGEEKGVLLVDLDAGEVTVRPLDARPMLDLPSLACEGVDEADVAPALYARLDEARLDGAIARLRVTGIPAHAYATLDFERIKRATASALHFDLRPEIVRGDATGATHGALGPLPDEFEAFLARRELGTGDRDALLDAAKALLREATSGPEEAASG